MYDCKPHMSIFSLVANSLDYCTWRFAKPKSVVLSSRCDVIFNSRSRHNVCIARWYNIHMFDIKVWADYNLLCHERIRQEDMKIVTDVPFIDRKINHKLMANCPTVNSSNFSFLFTTSLFSFYNYFIVGCCRLCNMFNLLQ